MIHVKPNKKIMFANRNEALDLIGNGPCSCMSSGVKLKKTGIIVTSIENTMSFVLNVP